MPAIGAFFPGIHTFHELIPDGAPPTVASDGESATLTDPCRIDWFGMGSGSTLAKILWDGTATGTIKIRSSASRPGRTDDDCLIQPADSEWTHYYDASGGSAPDAAGWTKVGTVTAGSPSGGVYYMDATGTAYFYKTTALGAADVTICRIGVRPKTGHAGAFEVWMDVGSTRYKFRLQGSAFGATAQKIAVNGVVVGGITWDYDEWMDLTIILRNGVAMLHHRARGSNARTDLIGMVAIADMPSVAGANLLLIGDVDTGVGCDVDIDHIGLWQGAEWETVTDGDTSFAATSQREYVQPKGWESGTLTEVDLQSDLSAPGNPSGPEAAAVGASAIGGNCTTLASGAAAYFIECLDADAADAVVDSAWEYEPAKTFRGLTVPGNFKMRFTSASDDGVRGSSSVTTSSTPVPSVAPSIALAINDTTLDPGQTATITPTITGSATVSLDGVPMTSGVAADAVTGNSVAVAFAVSPETVSGGETAEATATLPSGVTATLNGDAWDGTATTVVTGTAGALIGPTAPAPTIGWITYPRPTVSWS